MVFTIKERQEFGSPNFINVVNLVFRFCQIVLCAAVIGIYASAVSDPLWRDLRSRMVSESTNSRISISEPNFLCEQILAEACGAISLAVAVIFAAIPFLISYYYVAVFFILELVSPCPAALSTTQQICSPHLRSTLSLGRSSQIFLLMISMLTPIDHHVHLDLSPSETAAILREQAVHRLLQEIWCQGR